jgi:hypothetical protein
MFVAALAGSRSAGTSGTAGIVDEVASEIYKLQIKDGGPFNELNIEAKRFYRRIARWHIKKMKNSVQYVDQSGPSC